jgi:hypothetical protein
MTLSKLSDSLLSSELQNVQSAYALYFKSAPPNFLVLEDFKVLRERYISVLEEIELRAWINP